MNNQTEPKISKLPFIFGDAVLIALAGFIYWQGPRPLGHWDIGFVLVCCAVGAGLMIAPFLLEYQALVRFCEIKTVASSLEQIKDLQSITALISAATARWQAVQEQSERTIGAARNIAERVSTEAAGFAEFLQKANDGERASLRLEVEKLRRAEAEWLETLVLMLDHTYALHQAAMRTGQPGLIEQLSNFQNACRDAARRVGVVPFAATANEPFNGKLHQLQDSSSPQPGAAVGQTIATGYNFQGRLVRPALVTLRPEDSANPPLRPGKDASLHPNGNGNGNGNGASDRQEPLL